MHRSLLVLLLLSIGVAAEDHFEFDMTFFCEMRDRDQYNLRVTWFEHDRGMRDNQITEPKTLSPKVGKFYFQQNGAQQGDTIFSSGYEPLAAIYHDCTVDGKTVYLELRLTNRCKLGTVCNYRVVYDLTNAKGTKNMESQGFKNDWKEFPDEEDTADEMYEV